MQDKHEGHSCPVAYMKGLCPAQGYTGKAQISQGRKHLPVWWVGDYSHYYNQGSRVHVGSRLTSLITAPKNFSLPIIPCSCRKKKNNKNLLITGRFAGKALLKKQVAAEASHGDQM